jgi:molybdopterin converting factor small subunit
MVEYFALFRELAGCDKEIVETDAVDAAALYEEISERHSIGLEPGRMKVAINDEFADWTTSLSDGDRVVFIPPVAGG